ncbi:MAG: hypothetical protein ACOC2X_03655, partial [Bacillota bacterium]
ETLDETIDSIEFDQETQTKIHDHEQKVNALREAYKEALEKEKAQTDETLRAISEKESAYEDKVEAVKDKLSSKDQSARAARFEKEIDALKEKLKNDANKKTAQFKAAIAAIEKTHHQSMEALKKSLDEDIAPIIKAYEKFTRKASSSQKKALKKAQKQVDERLRNRLKDIDATYDHQLQ